MESLSIAYSTTKYIVRRVYYNALSRKIDAHILPYNITFAMGVTTAIYPLFYTHLNPMHGIASTSTSIEPVQHFIRVPAPLMYTPLPAPESHSSKSSAAASLMKGSSLKASSPSSASSARKRLYKSRRKRKNRRKNIQYLHSTDARHSTSS